MEHLYSLYDALVSISVPSDRARQVVQAMERDMSGELATKPELQTVRTELFGAVERCRLELRAEIERLRQETKADIELLRQETKADIELLRQETKADIDLLRQETKADIDLLRQEMHAGFALLRSEMHAMSQQMTIKLGSMMVVSVGLIVTLQKLL